MAIQPEALFQCLKADLVERFGPSFLKDCEGSMWPDITKAEAAGYSIYKSFLKKLETGRTKETDQRSLAKFLEVNSTCKAWKLPDQFDSRTETLLGEVRRAIYEFWFKNGEPLDTHPLTLLEKGSVGPGVSIGSEGNSFYAKLFSSRLTCSRSGLYFWYRHYIKSFPEWNNAENIRILNYGEASVVASNRLSFVPKNDEISRTICIEPTLDTIFQAGFGRILERRLSERYGISLDTQQTRNRDLACFGSLFDDTVTIDLSSASDSISLPMLAWLLPSSFYQELLKYRSHQAEIKGHGTVQLEMVSTMGNGFTFPLQTALFACIVIAAFRFRGIPFPESSVRNSWGVNGDDIACPEFISQDVIHLLHVLGFRTNDDKTFVKGPFRESCGSDFFLGSDIRGVYVKTLKTPGSRYAVLNLLTRFSTRTGLLLPKTWAALRATVAPVYVPVWENMDCGIQVPLSFARPFLRFDIQTYGYFYHALMPLSRKVVIEDGYVVVPRRCKRLIYNPSGLLISYLQQGITGGQIGIRDGVYKFIRKRRVTSSWDNYSLGNLGCPWQWWNTTVLFYLEKGE